MALKECWTIQVGKGRLFLKNTKQEQVWIPLSSKEAVGIYLQSCGLSADETVDFMFQMHLIRNKAMTAQNLVHRYSVFLNSSGEKRPVDWGYVKKLLAAAAVSPKYYEYPFPRVMKAIVTDRCSGLCKYCYDEIYRKATDVQELSIEEWSRILKQAEEVGIYQMILIGGEPFEKKGIMKVIEEAAAAHIYVEIVSKHLFSQEEAQKLAEIPREFLKIILSADLVPGQEDELLYTFEGESERILQSYRELKAAGIQPAIQTVVTSKNLKSIQRLVTFYTDLGTKEFRLSRFCVTEGKEEFCVSDSQWEELKRKLISQKDVAVIWMSEGVEKKTSAQVCVNGSTCMVVLPDGEVCFCDYFRDIPNNYIGNLKNRTLLDVWNSEIRRERVKQHVRCYAELQLEDPANSKKAAFSGS